MSKRLRYVLSVIYWSWRHRSLSRGRWVAAYENAGTFMISGAARVAPEKAVFRPALPMSFMPGISECK